MVIEFQHADCTSVQLCGCVGLVKVKEELDGALPNLFNTNFTESTETDSKESEPFQEN